MLSAMRNATAAALVLALCCTASCSRKEAEINGIGKWVLGKTTLAEAPGFCSPDTITFCSANGAVPIGNQVADVNLYFRGGEPDSPLVEIELAVRRCNHQDLVPALIDVLGEPNVRKQNHYIWKSGAAFIAGVIPAQARRCELSFVSPDDKKRVAELTAAANATSPSSP